MAKLTLQKLADDPAAMKSWLTETFGAIKTVKDKSGLFITTAAKNPRVVEGEKIVTLVPVEGDGNSPGASLRNFFELVTRSGKTLALGKDEKHFSLNAGSLKLQAV